MINYNILTFNTNWTAAIFRKGELMSVEGTVLFRITHRFAAGNGSVVTGAVRTTVHPATPMLYNIHKYFQ